MHTALLRTFLASLVMGLAIAHPAFAEKPSWAGNGGGDKHGSDKHGGEKKGSHDNASKGGASISIGAYFDSGQRHAAREYYSSEFNSGRCPPGLAKKGNGCMPPGQAKKWAVGQPLPSSVVYYSVPTAVVARIGLPPAGHKYVRVASDILLITLGTSMVVDAIQDLGSM